jgi:hypothetical protein
MRPKGVVETLPHHDKLGGTLFGCTGTNKMA